MDAREREETPERRPARRSEPGLSPLLTHVSEELRQERLRLDARTNWRGIAEAEREIAPAVAAEARRRLREAVARRAGRGRARDVREAEEWQRFGLTFRLQHIGLLASTLALIATGLPLRYAETGWARAFFAGIGGVAVGALVHRTAAALLIAVGAFHLLYIVSAREGRQEFRSLLPGWKDVADLLRNLAYFVGLTGRPPRFDRFSYVEKFDYWAVYWGMVIMIGSGLLLWSPGITMSYLPKYLMDIVQVIHSDEALLAAIAIAVWHFYNVHLNPDWFPMNWAWLTGGVSRAQMRKHHPLEYQRALGDADGSGVEEELSG